MVNFIIKFLSSQLFANVLLLITVLVALLVGYRQILLNDVVEIYAIPGFKEIVRANNPSQKTYLPTINIQNVGTRLVYLDKYVFNGTEYKTMGQVLPSAYTQANGVYWIDLPTNGTTHVSLVLYYHDLDDRYWKSEVVADFSNSSWNVNSLPRISQ